MKHVHRGRQIIAAYAVLHLIVTGAILILGWKLGAPLQSRVIGAVFQTMLIHRLWLGSRWAQWIHVASFVAWAFVLAMFCIKRPHPFLLVVLGPMAFVFAWLAVTFAFSRSIREFLAHQRERVAEEARKRSLAKPAPALAAADGAWDDDEPLGESSQPCRKCGLDLKNFVLLCPECGTRREALT